MTESASLLELCLCATPEELATAAAAAGEELLGLGGVHVRLWRRDRPGGVVGATRGAELSARMLATPLHAHGRELGEVVVDQERLDERARRRLETLCAVVAEMAARLLEADQRERESSALLELLEQLVARREDAPAGEAGRGAVLARALAERLAREDPDVPSDLGTRLAGAYPLLELGKLLLPDALLLRRERLTHSEQQLLRCADAMALELLAPLAARAGPGSSLMLAVEVLAAIDERWDGGGPRGLAGDAIPLAARIAAVVRAGGLGTRGRIDDDAGPLPGRAHDPRVVRAWEALAAAGRECARAARGSLVFRADEIAGGPDGAHRRVQAADPTTPSSRPR